MYSKCQGTPGEGKGTRQDTVLVAVGKWMDHKLTELANLLEENRDTKDSAVDNVENLRIMEQQPTNQSVGVI